MMVSLADDTQQNRRGLVLGQGGPTYLIERRLHLEPPVRALRLIFASSTVLWGVTVVVAGVDALLGRGTASSSLLTMFGFHVRALLGVPLLFTAGIVLSARVEVITSALVKNGIVAGLDVPKWDRLMERLERWRDKTTPEALPLVLVAAVLLVGIRELVPNQLLPWGMPLFHGGGAGATASWAWWWYVLAIQPLFLFLILRFLWHWVLWSIALVGFARMRLQLQASHADRAGGIGVLAAALDGFNLAIFALAIVLVGTWADEIVATGVKAARFAPQFVALVAIAVTLPFLPYLPLSIHLLRSKRLGAAAYGHVMRRYIRAFDAKYVVNHDAPVELGTADLQSLADAGSSLTVINEMRSTVFAGGAVVRVFVLIALPVLALVAMKMPAAEIARTLLGIVT